MSIDDASIFDDHRVRFTSSGTISVRFIVILLFLIGCPASAYAQWTRADTANYVIYSKGSEAEIRSFAVKVERFTKLMQTRLQVKADPDQLRLTIFMLTNRNDVESAIGRDVSGYYTAHTQGAYAVTHREKSNVNGQSRADTTLFHELGHHFMMRYGGDAYPAWLVEGFADFYSTVAFDKNGRPELGAVPYRRSYALLQAIPIRIEKMFSGFPDYSKEEEVASFYGRAWALTHYLYLSGKRQGQLTKYVGLMQTGVSSIDAAKQVFGDLAALDDEIDAYIKQRRLNGLVIRDPILEPTDINITKLDDGESAFVPLRLKVRDSRSPEAIKSVNASITQMLAKHPKIAEGWVLLGDTEMAARNFRAAIAAADEALKIDPNLARALMLRGWSELRLLDSQTSATSAQWKSARSWVVKANRQAPNDPLILLTYFRSFEMEGIPKPPIARSGLQRAFALSPENNTVRSMLARDYAAQKQHDTAINLMRPIAYGPHGGGAAKLAASLIERLSQAKAKQSTSVAESEGD